VDSAQSLQLAQMDQQKANQGATHLLRLIS